MTESSSSAYRKYGQCWNNWMSRHNCTVVSILTRKLLLLTRYHACCRTFCTIQPAVVVPKLALSW